MSISRRRFLATAGAWTAAPAVLLRADRPTHPFEPRHHLHQQFDDPVLITGFDVLKQRGKYYVRVRSRDGGIGITYANQGRLLDLLSLFQRRIVPFFLGKDARDLETLIDDVYTWHSSYKLAGMPFWNCVAHAELAMLDLLARKKNVRVGPLLGKVIRTEIPVYMSRFERETTAEEALEKAAASIERTGAKAVKLKIGLRMRNDARQRQRDRRLIELVRDRFGAGLHVFVDANSSYTVAEAIEMGRFLESHEVGFFEEPCPWQEYEDTKRVADTLGMTVAGGEQDSSLARWNWMIENRCVDLVQPDIFYNGGLIRALRVARMAQAQELQVTPHSPKTGAEAYANLHFCSIAENLGPFQEYREAPEFVDGKVSVPSGPGLGIDYDVKDWAHAEVVWQQHRG